MAKQWPALVVTSGPQAGQCFTVRSEHVIVGRSADADIHLSGDGVSRRHLRVSRQGEELSVQDLGSSNGTWVNGTRVVGSRVLGPHDTLYVGDVELQYVVLGAPAGPGPAPSSTAYQFGDVGGPVNTGDPVLHRGNQIVGTGNIHQGDRYDLDLDNGFQELFSGRGPGRVVMAFGLVIAVIGFAIWMSVIFSFGTTMEAGPASASPFEKEIFGFNAPITGFAMFGIGGLLLAIGSSMSKAARQRDERRRR